MWNKLTHWQLQKLTEAARKQKKVSDLVHTQRKDQTHYDLSMRRSTIADVTSTHDVHRRRSSGTQRRVQTRKQSMGSALDMDRTRVSTLPRQNQNQQTKPISQSKSSSSQLLNLAVREEVQRRVSLFVVFQIYTPFILSRRASPTQGSRASLIVCVLDMVY